MGEKKKVVYILGPLDEEGMEHYALVDDMLTDLGYETISPVILPEALDKGKAHFIAVAMIESADAVVALYDWQRSEDAVVEHHLAICFGKPMVEMEYTRRTRHGSAVNPPDIIKAWLKHDLEQVLEEVSA